jgi:predicted metal-dependent phosphoesterase TrpH
MTSADAPVWADLHSHTTASDGTFTPTELINAARAAELSYVAVTDHDTTGGLAEAISAARVAGLRFIPGVELSAEGAPGKCHLLGLGIDPAHAEMNEMLAQLSANRRERNEKIAQRLTSLGIPLTLEEVTLSAPPGANVGRPHFAQFLVDKGVVSTIKEAFDRYLSDTGPAYVKKAVLTPEEAISLIHKAGGLCFIAHPGLVRLAEHETDETRIAALKALGMDGVEVYYPAHTPAQAERFLRLAQKMGLLVTGGSDFHGANKPHITLGRVVEDARLPAESISPQVLVRAL